VSLEVAAFPALDIGTVLRLRAGEDLERRDPVDLPDDGEEALHLVEATIEAEMRNLTGADELPLNSGVQQGIDRLKIAGEECIVELLCYSAVRFFL
jgi:hypothetical protein